MSTFKRFALPMLTAIAVIAIAVFSWKFSSLPSGHEESVEEYRNVAKTDINEKFRISQERFEQVQSEWYSTYLKSRYSGPGPVGSMFEQMFARRALDTAEIGMMVIDRCLEQVEDCREVLENPDTDFDSILQQQLLVEGVLREADCLMEAISFAVTVVDGNSGAGHKAIQCNSALLLQKAMNNEESHLSRVFCPGSDSVRLEIIRGADVVLTVRDVENEN